MSEKEKKMTEEQSLTSIGKHNVNADFTEDANTFKKDKSQTKWNLVGTLAEAYNVWQNAIKTGDQAIIERAAKVYWDLKSYITADFTSDANTFSKDKKRTKEELVYELRYASDQLAKYNVGTPEWERAYKLYKELQTYVIGDFTEDAKNPMYHKVMGLFTQLNRILGSQQFFRMLDKLTDAERNTLYNHPLTRDVDGLLP